MDSSGMLILGLVAIFALVIVGAFFVYRSKANVEIKTPVASMTMKTEDKERAGVAIGPKANLETAEIEDIVGGNRIEGQQGASASGKSAGVEIGAQANMKGAKMKGITGGDSIEG